jgi:GT2 family glycosyltransferase
MSDSTWVIMPILANRDLTMSAIASVLAQTVPVRLLLVNQGVEDVFRDELERLAEAYPEQILLWSHQPPLPSLAATWNRALRFVWATGGTEALVVNNDIELHRETIAILGKARAYADALFVSAVGVTAAQFRPDLHVCKEGGVLPQGFFVDGGPRLQTGGPDFSCFLISRACHERFAFDEAFTPAFCEDLDMHRRLMLAGEGRRIFSINLPFLHHSSQTLKSVDASERARLEQGIAAGSRAYYEKKWGGQVNAERFFSPFDQGTEYSTAGMPNPPTTPALQAWVQAQEAADG